MKSKKLVIVIIIFAILGTGCISSQTNSPIVADKFKVHLDISNQGDLSPANITIKIDNETVYCNQTPPIKGNTSENYVFIDLVLNTGTHQIIALENNTLTVNETTVYVDRELWVGISFYAPNYTAEHFFDFDVQDTKIGLT